MAYFKKYEDAKKYAETSGISYPYKIVWCDPIFVEDGLGNICFAPKEMRKLYRVDFEYNEPQGC